MDKNDFLQLKQGDKVHTFDFGTAYVYDWTCSGVEVILWQFTPSKPTGRCTEFNRHEIKCKIDE